MREQTYQVNQFCELVTHWGCANAAVTDRP